MSEDDGTPAESRTEPDRPSGPLNANSFVPLLPGMVLAGRYEIRKLLGQGGIGLVVEAFDRTLGLSVAIKIIRGEYAGERSWDQRLAREVKLARQIHHPNVCRVFDFAHAEGRAFLIMELAGRGTLRDEIASGATRARPLGDRLADARAVASGLAAIHAAGIVHRDISPQNALRMDDGRLVVSDFGLATDAFDGATSMRGGTVAYMAPEIIRGGHASVASDIWALGVVIYEAVFGERPQWEASGGLMVALTGRERLTAEERGVLEICRACTGPNPERRPTDAAGIARRLAEPALERASGRYWRRRAAVSAVAILVVAMGGIVGVRHFVAARRRVQTSAAAAPAAPADPLMITPTGEPVDWTNTSKVLAEVPERIRCMVPLPDHHTVRFVWGYPPHAEDLDTHTGRRYPSPLVPDAYAEGCPSLSPDGKRLVYAGHTPDDRAFAFVSPHPNGSDGVPMVPTAEPSMNSDPTWLPDGDSFVYDADTKHVGIFSTKTQAARILPSDARHFYTMFRSVAKDRVVVETIFTGGIGIVTALSSDRLSDIESFKLPHPVLDLQSVDDDKYLGIDDPPGGGTTSLLSIDATHAHADRLANVKGQTFRYPVYVSNGLLFVSAQRHAWLAKYSSDGRVAREPTDDTIWYATACGRKVLASMISNQGSSIVHLGNNGRIEELISEYGQAGQPECRRDGELMFYYSYDRQAIMRCDGPRCRQVARVSSGLFALSGDGQRVVFVDNDNSGLMLREIDSDGRGTTRDVVSVNTACRPVWSGNHSIWIAQRRGRSVMWMEIDVDSGRATRREMPGTQDCTDGVPDPKSPVGQTLRVEFESKAQIRLTSEKDLSVRERTR